MTGQRDDRVTIGFVQMNTTLDETVYLPYSVALLQAYLRRHAERPDRYRFTLPIVRAVPVDDAVAALADADIAAFSAYVWNANRSLAIAQGVKEARPETLVVFGGPHVPDVAEDFLLAHPFIDVVCHGEGEQIFADIAERFPERRWHDVAGVSFLDEAGRFVTVARASRMADLSLVPSPFLTGVFDPLMQANRRTLWRTAWETNRGCPFKCTFCDWGSAIAAKVHRFELDRVFEEAAWIAANRIEYVFLADANFGILPRDVEIAEAIAAAGKRHGYPRRVLVQQTKNATERAYVTVKTLADAGMATEMNISIQSATPRVLDAIKRQNISLETYAELQRRFVRDGIPTYVDIIVGLPAETLETFRETVSSVVEGGQHHRVQFHNLSILPNAEMGDPHYQAAYGLETVTCDIVNNHAPPSRSDAGIRETQELVIATAAMPLDEWRKTRSFAWLASLYHFGHLLLLPILVTWKLSELPYWRVVDALIRADPARFPILGSMRGFCLDFAERTQRGEGEYPFAPEWLGSHWTVDEFLFIKLCVEEQVAAVYAEAEEVLASLLPPPGESVDPRSILADAVRLNAARLRHPFDRAPAAVDCEYDVHACCEAVLFGEAPDWRPRPVRYEIEHREYADRDSWLRDLIRDRLENKLADVRSLGSRVAETPMAKSQPDR